MTERAEFAFKNKEIEIGIDEAGRGPVLGPIVYGLAFWPYGVGDAMRKKYGFIDSKQVDEAGREEMFEAIKGMNFSELGWAVNVGMPYEISNL